jgi:hypothetical protein
MGIDGSVAKKQGLCFVFSDGAASSSGRLESFYFVVLRRLRVSRCLSEFFAVLLLLQVEWHSQCWRHHPHVHWVGRC